MSSFKILEYREKANSLYGIENKEITELELEALLEGKRLWTDINLEYAITIQLKDRLKELDIDRENKRLHSIIKEAIEYIEERKIVLEEISVVDDGTYSTAKETYDNLLEILDKGGNND